ncbi:4'-phosphopantetheinyl transferase superfamily protein [Streptomyces sp. ISL-66]|uniref:4'-phosphopantetheinyl transferase family protein n=1 Tax=Streptomyces sp. ISL-66 TaxID=2819186 RepID=UPI001BE7A92F|nr:4'-phosphopantetheinyl transferase superfamily protein [Streptomyces sp. ISL-66]MBT2472565.1 4'-phosphopantetheinyl transferase superfamily protein [Streptomyces sp. ISL-66]
MAVTVAVAASRVEVWLAVPVGDQRRHAKALLRRAAGAVLGVGADELDVAREPGGRPYVVSRPGGRTRRPAARVPARALVPVPPPVRVNVSVSHTRGLTAVAVCTGADVGVDVEPVRELPALALARRWFGEEDARWIEGHDAALRSRALLWVWTHKEALGKARGTGLAGGGRLGPVPLPASGLPPAPAPGSPVALREIFPGAGMTSAVPGAPEGYVLCVAGGPGTEGLPVSVTRVDG